MLVTGHDTTTCGESSNSVCSSSCAKAEQSSAYSSPYLPSALRFLKRGIIALLGLRPVLRTPGKSLEAITNNVERSVDRHVHEMPQRQHHQRICRPHIFLRMSFAAKDPCFPRSLDLAWRKIRRRDMQQRGLQRKARWRSRHLA